MTEGEKIMMRQWIKKSLWVLCFLLITASILFLADRQWEYSQSPEGKKETTIQKILARESRDAENRKTARKVASVINYIKDPRTNLCFAVFWGSDNQGGPAITAVECTSAVEHEIKYGIWHKGSYYLY